MHLRMDVVATASRFIINAMDGRRVGFTSVLSTCLKLAYIQVTPQTLAPAVNGSFFDSLGEVSQHSGLIENHRYDSTLIFQSKINRFD